MITRIPDELAARLTAHGSNLSHRALERFALEELRAERIIESQQQTKKHINAPVIRR